MAAFGALTRCALFRPVCDLKAVQMNVQHSLIREHMLLEFELGHNAAAETISVH